LAFNPSSKTGFALLPSLKPVSLLCHYEAGATRSIAIWEILIHKKKKKKIHPSTSAPVYRSSSERIDEENGSALASSPVTLSPPTADSRERRSITMAVLSGLPPRLPHPVPAQGCCTPPHLPPTQGYRTPPRLLPAQGCPHASLSSAGAGLLPMAQQLPAITAPSQRSSEGSSRSKGTIQCTGVFLPTTRADCAFADICLCSCSSDQFVCNCEELGWRRRRPGAVTSRGGTVETTKRRRERLDPFQSGTERFSHGHRRRPQGRSGRMCILFFFTNQNSPNGNRAGSTSFIMAEERNQFERW
jgi:hypothetical protein